MSDQEFQGPPMWKLLLELDVSSDEFLSTLKAILDSREELNRLQVAQLQDEDAIGIIDQFDQFLCSHNAGRTLHKRCLVALRKTCSRCGILPTSYILSEGLVKTKDCASTSGGFADVWEGAYNGCKVAIKALRIYATDDLARVKKDKQRFCKEVVLWKRLSHPNVLPYRSACSSLRNPDMNRLELLIDAGRGLEYLHNIDFVHGDLKGANILINDAHHACLADFGLMTILSDPNTIHAPTTSNSTGGTTKWMAPELLDPEAYGHNDSKFSKQSDIYALGMVIFEVLTDSSPFHGCRDLHVIRKVTKGIRPERPTGANPMFSDFVWSLAEGCWHGDPFRRPSIYVVLDGLSQAATAWNSPLAGPLTESENEILHNFLTQLQEGDPSQPPTQFNVSPPGSSDISSTTSQSRFMTPNSSDFSFESLIPFDPADLNALDEDQSTATDDAMNLDFGFGKQTKPAFNILASDPMYMSFVKPSSSDSTSSPTGGLDFFAGPVGAPKPTTQASPLNVSPPGSSDLSSTTSQSRFMTPNSSDFSFGLLVPFDPANLNVLDENQSTATDDAMNMDFGFGKQTKPAFNIFASDPMYMSFIKPSPSDSTSSPVNSLNAFDFSLLEQWSQSGSQSNIINGSAMQTLHELVGGNNSFLSAQSGMGFSSLENRPSLLGPPIVHQGCSVAAQTGTDRPETGAQLFGTIGHGGFSSSMQSPPVASNPAQVSPYGISYKTGQGSFVNLANAGNGHPMVMCRGSGFPKPEWSYRNVDILSVWRSITSNPQFKDADINELCSLFTDKARCDGTKVVLEPEGVHSIIEFLNARLDTQQQMQNA